MKRRELVIKISVILGIALLPIGLYFLTNNEEPLGQRLIINIDKTKYPVTGIDISHHTGHVDFKKIRRQEIDFVYMKATEGVDFTDFRFEENYKNSRKHQVPVGVYHFFRFDRDGKVQAEHFLRKTAGKTFELPMVLDVEEWTNPEDIPDSTVISEINNFLTTVKEKTGKTPYIYTNESGYKRYLAHNFADEQIWICSLKKDPPFPNNWVFWQHSHEGKMDGAEGIVDINTFNGKKQDWHNFLNEYNLLGFGILRGYYPNESH